MKFDCKLTDYRIRPGAKVNLSKLPTDVKPLSKSKKQYQKLLAEYRAEIAERGRIGIFDRSYYEEVADRARRSRSPSSANACPKSWPIRKRSGTSVTATW
jgi:hypothetical protein